MKKLPNRMRYLLNNNSRGVVSRFITKDDFSLYDHTEVIYRELQQFVVLRISEYDPTPNKAYTQWLLREYEKSCFNLKADVPRIQGYVKYFDDNKKRFTLRDINQYRFEDLIIEVEAVKAAEHYYAIYDSIDSNQYENYLRSSGKVNKVLEIISGDSHVSELIDFEAVYFYSKNTKWCIRLEKVFEQYRNHGPLYLLLTKHDRYLLQYRFNKGEAEKKGNLIGWNIEIADSKNNLITDFTELYKLNASPNDWELGRLLYLLLLLSAKSKGVTIVRLPELKGMVGSIGSWAALQNPGISILSETNFLHQHQTLCEYIQKLESFFCRDLSLWDIELSSMA